MTEEVKALRKEVRRLNHLIKKKDEEIEYHKENRKHILVSIYKNLLFNLINQLPEREGKIIKMRWGLETGTTQSLELVGRYFDVTRERIRGLEARAIERLSKAIVLYDKRGEIRTIKISSND